MATRRPKAERIVSRMNRCFGISGSFPAISAAFFFAFVLVGAAHGAPELGVLFKSRTGNHVATNFPFPIGAELNLVVASPFVKGRRTCRFKITQGQSYDWPGKRPWIEIEGKWTKYVFDGQLIGCGPRIDIWIGIAGSEPILAENFSYCFGMETAFITLSNHGPNGQDWVASRQLGHDTRPTCPEA